MCPQLQQVDKKKGGGEDTHLEKAFWRTLHLPIPYKVINQSFAVAAPRRRLVAPASGMVEGWRSALTCHDPAEQAAAEGGPKGGIYRGDAFSLCYALQATRNGTDRARAETKAHLVGRLLGAVRESRAFLQGELHAVGEGVARHEGVGGVVEAKGVDAHENVVENVVVVRTRHRDALALDGVGD